MKVLFAHLGREHLGVEYMSAVLKQQGHETSLALDPGLFGINDNVFHNARLERRFDQSKRVLRALEEHRPDLAAFTVYTSTFPWALRMAREFKRRSPRTPIVFGGLHPTFEPERTLQCPDADFIIRGEGEGALCDLAHALEHGTDPREIPNLGYRAHDGSPVLNPLRPLIGNLDALPFPDKGLFERDVNFRNDYIVLCSRGCPHRCSYCCENALHRLHGPGWYRRRSAESVLLELEEMKARYRFREVMFNDPILLTHRGWLEELLEGYRRRIRVPFRCFGQPALMTDAMALLLKHSGCQCVEFGLQTVNEDLKRKTLGRTETNDQALNAFRICDRHGLPFDIDHMFGLPGECAADHARALDFYKPLRRLNRIKTHQLVYFPGTAITEEAAERGILAPDDLERIRSGEAGDFFHGGTRIDAEVDKQITRGFATAMKLLPLVPRAAVRALSENPDRAVFFARIPGPIVILLQAIIALLHGDYRFPLYIKYYALRLWRARGNTGALPE